MNKIKVVCFGLQGYGNNLLNTLQNHPQVDIVALYTRKSSFNFDYYQCERLETLAERINAPLFYIEDKGEWSCVEADLSIIHSFHRIFKKKHLSKYSYTINIHTSLLPKYKGATPTNWMIKNGEKIVGVSAHLVDEGIDTGDILFQKRLLNPYLNDNQLRRAFAFFSEQIIDDIIINYPNYSPLTTEELTASFFSGRTKEDALLKIEDIKNIEQLIFHIKAFTNFPMPKIQIENKVFVIDYDNPKDTVEIVVNNQTFSIIGYWQ